MIQSYTSDWTVPSYTSLLKTTVVPQLPPRPSFTITVEEDYTRSVAESSANFNRLRHHHGHHAHFGIMFAEPSGGPTKIAS